MPLCPHKQLPQQPKLSHQELGCSLAQVRQGLSPHLTSAPGQPLSSYCRSSLWPLCWSTALLCSHLPTHDTGTEASSLQSLPAPLCPPSSPTLPHVHPTGHPAFWSVLVHPFVPPLSLPLPPPLGIPSMLPGLLAKSFGGSEVSVLSL